MISISSLFTETCNIKVMMLIMTAESPTSTDMSNVLQDD